MIEVNIPAGVSKITTPTSLYQWDYGQVLQITGDGMPSVCHVHFANKTTPKAIVRLASPITDGITVPIPDILLENEWEINAFVYVCGEGCGQTIKQVQIPVIKRKQPEDYTEEIPPSMQTELEAMIANVNTQLETIEELYNNTITEEDLEQMISASVDEKTEELKLKDTELEANNTEIKTEIEELKNIVSTLHNSCALTITSNPAKLTFTSDDVDSAQDGTAFSRGVQITSDPSTASPSLNYSTRTTRTDAVFSISVSGKRVYFQYTTQATRAGTNVYKIYDTKNPAACVLVEVEVVI